ncbi:MAG: tetratricopeptide repeat protein [Prevotella sp.]|jgi:tetratricopeptide (TPR) repeat protein|nr:tetratricopeptide repeat protein [Prevotella sp.]
MAEKNVKNNAHQNEPALSKSEDFFLKNKKIIIGAVVAIIAIIALWVVIDMLVITPNRVKAQEGMAKGQTLFANDMMQQAIEGDSTGFAGFAKLADEYSGKNANLANLYTGLAYAQKGNWEEAVKYLEKFDDQGDQMVSPAAEGALGNAYAHLNKLDEAVKHLKNAAKRADNNSLSPTFLIQAGEILESQGKKAEAVELYKEVKEKYFQSMQYQTIDAYIERASN